MPKLTITACAAGLALAAGSAAAAKDAAPSASEEPLRAELGQPAPDFTLTDLEGKEYRLGDYDGKIVVLEWFNPDCPFVKKHHLKNKTMAETYARFRDDGVVWLAINSGGPGKQGHGKERNVRAREQYGIVYPLLLDETGRVGRMYEAKTTPHMYVIDRDGILVYRGAIDDNRSPGTLGETNYVAECLAALFAGKHPELKETKSYGCSVKYASKSASLP
jgi:peroxiredoxin